MKQLKKNPLVQRMEDMTFPLQKPSKKGYKFIGKPDRVFPDLISGKVYDLVVVVYKEKPLIVSPFTCPYSSWMTFYANWEDMAPDMTLPLQKVDPNPKSLGFSVAVKKLLDEGTKPKKDMTFPITKTGKKMNKIIARALDGKKPLDLSGGVHKSKGKPLTISGFRYRVESMKQEPISPNPTWFTIEHHQPPRETATMTGREWLRSINDDNGFTLMPRIIWRVVAVVILVIICLVIIL